MKNVVLCAIYLYLWSSTLNKSSPSCEINVFEMKALREVYFRKRKKYNKYTKFYPEGLGYSIHSLVILKYIRTCKE